MHGLVSLLPTPFYERVEAVWNELEKDHGLHGIRVTPYPHFSWQIASDYDFEAVSVVLADIANTTKPFLGCTGGVAVFSGLSPVIYIPVVRNPLLQNLHTTLWERTQKISEGLSPYYSPTHWMPHISLAYGDVTKENIGAVMEVLAFQEFNWELKIDDLSMIYEPDGETGALKYQYKLTG